MVYGAEVSDNTGCIWQTGELKTKTGIVKRLEQANIIKSIYTGYGWRYEAINGNRFVLYCRTEYKNPNDKSSYSKLEGNMRGSWELL